MQFDLSHWTPLTSIVTIGVIIYILMHAVAYCIKVWRGDDKGAASDNNAIQVLTQMVTANHKTINEVAQNQIPPSALPQLVAMLNQQMADHQRNLTLQQQEYADQSQLPAPSVQTNYRPPQPSQPVRRAASVPQQVPQVPQQLRQQAASSVPVVGAFGTNVPGNQ